MLTLLVLVLRGGWFVTLVGTSDGVHNHRWARVLEDMEDVAVNSTCVDDLVCNGSSEGPIRMMTIKDIVVGQIIRPV